MKRTQILVVLLAILCLGDVVTTNIILTNGGQEANIYLTDIAGNVPLFLLVKVGFVVGLVLLAYSSKLTAPTPEWGVRMTTIILAVGVIAHLIVVPWNIYQILWYFRWI